jgi:hypothetical protein
MSSTASADVVYNVGNGMAFLADGTGLAVGMFAMPCLWIPDFSTTQTINNRVICN